MPYGYMLNVTSQPGSGYDRVRVDVGQTGFFEGREFRTFRDLNMSTGTTLVIKAVVPINIILFGLDINLLEGELRVETVAGGTEGGTFSETLPIFARNTTTERPEPLYSPQVVLAAGGTHTGGTILDVLVNKAGANAQQAGSVGVAQNDERGVGAATYYFRLTATGTVRGTFKARWEERP